MTQKGESIPLPHRSSGGLGAGLLVVFFVLLLIALGILIGRRTPTFETQAAIGWALASFVFGTLVGLSEILSRYRDEPILASTTAFGLSYLVLNGAISLAAFAVLRMYPRQIFPAVENDLFLTAVIAGFGGMSIFRSKLFTFRSSDGKEYPIGPAIVLDTTLKTIDSKIDRRRSRDRQIKVFNAMININDFANTANYVEASLGSFQNLSLDDKTQIITVIDQYRKGPNWPETLKSLGLGFAFLNIAGEENFDQVIENLRSFLLKEEMRSRSSNPAGGVNQANPPTV